MKVTMMIIKGFPGGSVLKNPPARSGDPGSIPGSGRSPGEGNGNPFQYLVWRIPWTEEPDVLPSMGSQRVRRECSNLAMVSEVLLTL